jgi:hypothetical protein
MPNPIRKIRSLHVHDGDVVFAAGGIGGVDQGTDDRGRVVCVVSDDSLHLDGRHQVGQTIRTEQHGGIRLQTGGEQLDEIVVRRLCGRLPTSRNISLRRG